MPRRNYLTYSDLIEDAKKVNELIGKSLKEEQIINHNGRKSYIPLWNEEAKEILSLNRKSEVSDKHRTYATNKFFLLDLGILASQNEE
jgi:hypothetical protein